MLFRSVFSGFEHPVGREITPVAGRRSPGSAGNGSVDPSAILRALGVAEPYGARSLTDLPTAPGKCRRVPTHRLPAGV